jgi:hypothetical protein
MTRTIQRIWENSAQNAEIAASAKVNYCNEQSDMENLNKYGSMNFLVLANNSSNQLKVTLDGKIFTTVGGNSTLILDINDGKYFNILGIENLSSTDAISANSITLNYGRLEAIEM